MPTQQAAQSDRRADHRATRWPRPDALSFVLFAGWALGILLSTVVPYLVVPPTSPDPDPARVGIAFGITMVGIAIFAGCGALLAKHLKSQAVLVFALVPVVSIFSGGIILTATLLAL